MLHKPEEGIGSTTAGVGGSDISPFTRETGSSRILRRSGFISSEKEKYGDIINLGYVLRNSSIYERVPL